ncbi:MAG: UDP-N-acetylglucosamine 2-epimerase (hydrolyzing) [Alphaproteobacteria bacterium]|nr:UDP-N-acetylglucosamine 2-epimerase (hydrolyzing) [Alphaproteobacteria bacterium]
MSSARRKICVAVTARPSYSRIRSALVAIRARNDLDLQLIAAASALSDKYGTVVDVMQAEGFRIDRRVEMGKESGTLLAQARSTGIGLTAMADAFDALKPDWVVSVADRFETMATAVAAAYMNIPLAHVQGGEVTGNIDEKVRHAVTKLADLHLVANEKAQERVVRMGERPSRVVVTGCPSIDVAREAAADPAAADALVARLAGETGLDLAGGFLIVSQHSVTNEHEDGPTQTARTAEAIAATGLPALWFWPNLDAGSDGVSRTLREWRDGGRLPRVCFIQNVPPEDFIRLLLRCHCIIGNSSVAIRECAWLGVPAVNIGSRQSGRDRGANVQDVNYDSDEILAAIRRQTRIGRYAPDTLYGDGHAGEKIAAALATATPQIDKRLAYDI